MNAETLDKSFIDWVKLFFDYGPFFITLFIMIFGVRFAQKALTQAENLDGKHAAEQVRFYRRIYASVWIFSGLLVVVSCTWWIVRGVAESSKEYVLRIDVSDVQPTDRLEPFSDQLFYRARDISDPTKRKDSFVAVDSKPFRLNQHLVIVHKKGADAAGGFKYPVTLSQKLLDERNISYRLIFKDGAYSLQEDEQPSSRSGFTSEIPGIGTAYALGASNTVIPAQAYLPPKPPVQQISSGIRDVASVARSLLDERTSLSKQIEALDFLITEVAKGTSINLLQTRQNATDPKGETLLSYLLTLSRHEDKLVSYKARTLLEKTGYLPVVASIASGSAKVDPAVERQILLSLTDTDWSAVEEKLKHGNIKVVPAKRGMQSRDGSPIPSATSNGTKYYAIVSWGKLAPEQVACLANKVYRQSSEPQSVEDARSFVESRNAFVAVYDYKSEGMIFAGTAEQCGAKTEFVYKSDKKITALQN